MEEQRKWQPIMLIVERRVECECGVLAVFLILDEKQSEDEKQKFGYTSCCQDCFEKAMEEV